MAEHKNNHFICLALPAWEADYLRSTVELMQGVAKNNLVLYVDYAYTLTDLVKGMFGRKRFDWKRLLGLRQRLRQISGDGENGFFVLSLPPVLPSFAFKSTRLFTLSNKINAAVTGYFINRAINKLQMSNIIGFNSFQPFLGNYWKINNLKFLVYYIYDDFTNVPWFKGFTVDAERKFISKADLIIVSSDELKRRNLHINKPVEVINNGVHFQEFFNNLGARKFNDGYIKTVGYTGTMDDRIDLDLLEEVVKGLPHVRFLFIGKVRNEAIHERLLQYINVCFEPPVHPQKIPYMQRQLDAGIIPYVCNDLTAAINPLKANEYLAMGLPVIMTPFASLGEADKVVYTAPSAGDFIESIRVALSEEDPSIKKQRIIIAAKADWSERANQLIETIDYYKNKLAKVQADLSLKDYKKSC